MAPLAWQPWRPSVASGHLDVASRGIFLMQLSDRDQAVNVKRAVFDGERCFACAEVMEASCTRGGPRCADARGAPSQRSAPASSHALPSPGQMPRWRP